MALLIDIKQPGWMEDEVLQVDLQKVYPQGDIRSASNPGNLDEIRMIAVSTYETGQALRYPNLKLVQKIGAGVNGILDDRTLPESIQVARLKTETPAHEMAEFSLACVLQEQRHLRQYRDNQARWRWQAEVPRQAEETTVAVLGLGLIGSTTARRFVDNRFKVIGWSRTQKELPGIECYFGEEQFPTVLQVADYVVSILPSTPETAGLFNAEIFPLMKPRAVLINCGRGDLINEVDLIEALDNNLLETAILDVMQTEPLPVNSLMWQHPDIVLTPHVSGWHLGDAVNDIAENLRRLDTGEPLLHLVDRELGY
jgi:glyoxylate/hydroxypyruvate reductase A